MNGRVFSLRRILVLLLIVFLPAEAFSTHLDSRPPPKQTPGPQLSRAAMDALRNPPDSLSMSVKGELEEELRKATDPILRTFFRSRFDRLSYSVQVIHLRNSHGIHFSAQGKSSTFPPKTITLEVFHKGGNEAVEKLYGVWFEPDRNRGIKLYRFPSADRAAFSNRKQQNAESFYWQRGEHYIETQATMGAIELAKNVNASAEKNGFYNFPGSIAGGHHGSGDRRSARLLRAIESGDKLQVEDIIQRGGNLEGEPGEMTPLILAAEMGHLEIVDILLRAGAKPNTRGPGDTSPLIKAAEKNHPLIVKKLIDAGSETNVKDDGGATALAAAIRNGNAIMLKDLIETGADVNSSTIYEGDQRLYRTPLMVAAEANKPLETLVLLRAEAKPDKHGEKGDTPLMIAASFGWKDIVTLLLAAGADTALKNDSGKTALDIAERERHREIADQLILISGGGHHPQPHQSDNPDRYSSGASSQPHSVAETRRYPVRDQALVHNDMIAAGKTGQTTRYFELLDDEKGDVNSKDAKGNTALMFAAYNGHASMVNALLNETQSDVNKVNNDGNSALTFAAQRGNDWIVSALLQAGADIHHKNKNGKTPLMYATEQGHANVIQTLKDAGANY